MIRGNDPILLTPGPLTTSLETKQAMLRDWGSWDASFNSITASICKDLVAIVNDVSQSPIDALVAASGKCIEGAPGMGFVIVKRAVLEKSQGNSHSLAMDLHDQWTYMQKTTQWRFTPPTHVVAAFRSALDQFKAEGGQPARGARYRKNCETLVDGMAALGLRAFLPRELQAPVIVTFHAPSDPNYAFKAF